MMEPMKPEVMIGQVNDLPTMNRELATAFLQAAASVLTAEQGRKVQRVFITGDGDSYHAARGAEMAFENIARIPCEPMSAQRFLDYGAEWMPVKAAGDTLVLAISASGRTQRVVQSVERAREYGALTVGVTGNAGSPLALAAEHQLILQLPDMGPSPGIRTYNASLLGLYGLALALGEQQLTLSAEEAGAIRTEISELTTVMAATLAASEPVCHEIVAALKGADTMVWLGSGPSYGTALFAAAKVVEAAGLFAIGQDLEEWAHVERFAYPDNMPVFIIAPPGRSHWRAVALAKTAKAIGHRVIALVDEGDQELAEQADYVLPVAGAVREEFTPLVYHIASNFIASYWATSLGRYPFHSNDAAFREASRH
ncbi:MAG: SIS domain-containing protein [Anaerolineales bacterium]|nr:SIS domain-containing protein [Anaerolineales bacterium]